MKESLTRRQFLATSGALAVGVSSVSLCARRAVGEAMGPKLRVTCRDSHLKVTGAKDCWSALETLGAEGVEATIGEDLSLPGLFHADEKYTGASEAGIEKLKADMQGAGKRITALCMYNRYDERPEFEIEWGTKVARVAQALGAKAVRIDVWPHKLAEAEFLELAAATLTKLVAATEETGVAFGIENHGRTTNDPTFLRTLFERVGSRRLGLTLDTGNFYWYGHPLSKLYGLYETFAPHVCHTHCKSIKFPEAERDQQRPVGWEYGKYNCPIDEGDIDFGRVVKILRAAGYANDLCVEDESLEKFPANERAAVLGREIRHLKELQ